MHTLRHDWSLSLAPALRGVGMLGDELRRAGRRLRDALHERWRLHLDRRALRAMSDDTLRDIGLERAEVERLIRERCL